MRIFRKVKCEIPVSPMNECVTKVSFSKIIRRFYIFVMKKKTTEMLTRAAYFIGSGSCR